MAQITNRMINAINRLKPSTRNMAKLIILVFSLIFIFIAMYLIIRHRLIYYRHNWRKYQCNPLYAPFAGYINGEKGFDALKAGYENTKKCVLVDIKTAFHVLTQPLMEWIDVVYGVILGSLDSVDGYRKQLAILRQWVIQMVMSVNTRIQDTLGAFMYTFLKLRDALGRSMAAFYEIFYALNGMMLMAQSFITGKDAPLSYLAGWAQYLGASLTYMAMGPLAFVAAPSIWCCLIPSMGICCFCPDTRILLDPPSPKGKTQADSIRLSRIQDVQVLDTVQGGNTILEKMVFWNYKKDPVYIYNNDKATAYHIVQNKITQKWCFMKDVGELSTSSTSTILYCLSTGHNHIHTTGGTYRDWHGMETPMLDTYYRILIARSLGYRFKNIVQVTRLNYPAGFMHIGEAADTSTPIWPYIQDQTHSKHEVPVDHTYTIDSTLTGFLEGYHDTRPLSSVPIVWYRPRGRVTPLVSGSTWYKSSQGWCPVAYADEFVKTHCDVNRYVNYASMDVQRDLQVSMPGWTATFKDLLETPDTQLLEGWEQEILQHLNA